MWTKVSEVIEQRITLLSQLLILLLFLLWGLSEFFEPLSSFLTHGTFFNVVTLVLLFEIGRRVVELKLHADAPSGATVFGNQDAAWAEMQGRIRSSRPKNVDMIEYSGQTVVSLIEEIMAAEPKAVVRLLVCHPDHALSPFEKRRIEATLEYLRQHMGSSGLVVKCYTVPAGMRGRNYANQVVSVGWYTYHQRQGKTLTEIQGHLNAMVVASATSPEGRDLMQTFDRAFDDLWTHPMSVEWTKLPLFTP